MSAVGKREGLQRIVVVSGLPRSGTSMMMQMLAAGGVPLLSDAARPADENNPRGYYELAEAKRLHADASWLPKARGHAVKVVAQLLPSLPPTESYRIVFMERPLREVIASQEDMLQRIGRHNKNSSKRRLAGTYAEQLGRVRRILRERSNHVSVLTVNYHSALSDPAATAARINAFLGGALDEAAIAAAVDPALRRQFRAA